MNCAQFDVHSSVSNSYCINVVKSNSLYVFGFIDFMNALTLQLSEQNKIITTLTSTLYK